MDALDDAVLGTEKTFTSNPKMTAFRGMIDDSTNMGTNARRKFVEAARELYPELSIKGAHDVISVAGVTPPKYDDFEEIASILKGAGITVKPSYLTVVSLALSPDDLPPMRCSMHPLLQ